MNILPYEIVKKIFEYSNFIDCVYLNYTNKEFFQIMKDKEIFNFEKYKKSIKIYIFDLDYLKTAICCALPNIYPNGHKVSLAINNIIGNDKYISYSKLLSLILILKLGRAVILSTSISEFNSIENWIRDTYSEYIDNLVILKNNVKNNIYLLINQNKIKSF